MYLYSSLDTISVTVSECCNIVRLFLWSGVEWSTGTFRQPWPTKPKRKNRYCLCNLSSLWHTSFCLRGIQEDKGSVETKAREDFQFATLFLELLQIAWMISWLASRDPQVYQDQMGHQDGKAQRYNSFELQAQVHHTVWSEAELSQTTPNCRCLADPPQLAMPPPFGLVCLSALLVWVPLCIGDIVKDWSDWWARYYSLMSFLIGKALKLSSLLVTRNVWWRITLYVFIPVLFFRKICSQVTDSQSVRWCAPAVHSCEIQ